MRKIVLAAAAVALLSPGAAFAHGGGLDASGCHHDRKRGGYHCHRAQTTPRSSETRASGTSTAKAAPPMVACLIKGQQLMAYTTVDCVEAGGKPQ